MARSESRGGVAETAPSADTILIVSVTAVPGAAAPCARPAATARSISAALANGRAAS